MWHHIWIITFTRVFGSPAVTRTETNLLPFFFALFSIHWFHLYIRTHNRPLDDFIRNKVLESLHSRPRHSKALVTESLFPSVDQPHRPTIIRGVYCISCLSSTPPLSRQSCICLTAFISLFVPIAWFDNLAIVDISRVMLGMFYDHPACCWAIQPFNRDHSGLAWCSTTLCSCFIFTHSCPWYWGKTKFLRLKVSMLFFSRVWMSLMPVPSVWFKGLRIVRKVNSSNSIRENSFKEFIGALLVITWAAKH